MTASDDIGGERPLASRAGGKLKAALDTLAVVSEGVVAADLGSASGGFVDVLLRAGAERVYAVEKGFGRLEWRLRIDPRVVVMEREDATTVRLPELCDLVTIDVGFTRQAAILPHALELLKPGGTIVSLLKPQYEASGHDLDRGKLTPVVVEKVVGRTVSDLRARDLAVEHVVESAVPGRKGAREFFLLVVK